MPHARINGIDLYYESYGEGPALVFAHGGGGNHLSWFQQVPEFSKNYRCITFDHRGFGESHDLSDGPGPNAYVEDLRQLLDHLGIEKATLVGQSMGGWSVLGFASLFPHRVEALVLCDTTAGMDDPAVIKAQAALRDNTRGTLGQVLARAYAAGFPQRDPVRCFLYQQITGLNRKVPPKLIPILMGMKHRVDAIIEKHIPTMLIVGEEDALIAPQIMATMAQRLPHSRFVKIPGAGHSVYFEQPEEFNRVLGEFLRGSVG